MLDVFINEAFYGFYHQNPVVLVDIGASGGTKDIWQGMDRYLQIIGFEPDEEQFNNLNKNRKGNEKYYNVALNDTKATVDFHVTRKQQLSSIFMPNRRLIDKFPEKERFDVLKTIKTDTDTLDNQLHAEADIDFIKIDTQGSELNVLRGANKTLSSVFGIELEVEFSALYENQPLFPDVDKFLRDSGFQLFDLRPWYWKRNLGMQYGMPKGQLIFADALYLRETCRIKEIVNRQKSSMLKKSKLLKTISICILFGYVDYAFELFKLEQDVFDAPEKTLFNEFFKKSILWRSGGRTLGNLEYIEEA